MNTNTRQHGFSLLEVLVAMAIAVIIYFGSYSLLDSVIKTSDIVSEKRNELESIQRAFYFIQQDFEQIIPRSVRAQYGQVQAAIVYKGIEQRIEFTRLGWKNPVNRPRSNMQRVSYQVENDVLYRLHWNALDRADESEAKKTPLLEGIERYSFRFYDPVLKQWVENWNKEANDNNILPAAIELSLMTKAHGELIRVFSLVQNREGLIEDGL